MRKEIKFLIAEKNGELISVIKTEKVFGEHEEVEIVHDIDADIREVSEIEFKRKEIEFKQAKPLPDPDKKNSLVPKL